MWKNVITDASIYLAGTNICSVEVSFCSSLEIIYYFTASLYYQCWAYMTKYLLR